MTQTATTRKRAQERRAQRRRQTQIRLMIGIGVIALVIAGVLILLSLRPASADITEFDYSGLDQSIDESGVGPGYALGDASAPVTLVEYSDFSCPHCGDLAPTIHRLIDDYVRVGQLRIVYKAVAFVNPPYSTAASQAAQCAAEQGKFWEMHDEIWSMYEANGPASYTESLLTARAQRLDLDTGAFSQCYSSQATVAAVQAILTETQGRGIQGTPTLFVNNTQVPFTGAEDIYVDLVAAIEAALGS